jgi:hypothetical protein
MEKDEKIIKFKYFFEKDYNPVYANGVFGGIAPSGELVIHFFQERQGLPTAQYYALFPNGNLGEEVKREPEDQPFKYVRMVTTGVTLSEKTARVLFEWLKDQMDSKWPAKTIEEEMK